MRAITPNFPPQSGQVSLDHHIIEDELAAIIGHELAMAAYVLATRGEEPVPDAYLNLGYLLLKKQRVSEARSNFRKYLELRPDSDDRAMIEFYLEERYPSKPIIFAPIDMQIIRAFFSTWKSC